MATPTEIAKWIIDSFDATETCGVEYAVERVLREQGVGRFAASSEATEKWQKVLGILRSLQPEEIPFGFSDSDDRRLIGKKKRREQDSLEDKRIRDRVHLVTLILEQIRSCDGITFEWVCAGLMRLSGASWAVPTAASDDGGIDVYGRISLRTSDPKLTKGLVRSTFLDKHYLYLAQCKHWSQVGRGEIIAFEGSVAACLRKYEGNAQPPANRVPSSFYRRDETAIQVFFTTGDYSADSRTEAEAKDIILVNGQQIAEFLIYHGIGIVHDSVGSTVVDHDSFSKWLHELRN